MSSRIRVLTLALALTGCAVEHGDKAPQHSGAAQPSGMMPQAGSNPGPMHTVFARDGGHGGVGARRISLSVMLIPETDRRSQRAALQAVLDAERRADSSFAAVRVLGFFPPNGVPGGHPGGMAMIPSVDPVVGAGRGRLERGERRQRARPARRGLAVRVRPAEPSEGARHRGGAVSQEQGITPRAKDFSAWYNER